MVFAAPSLPSPAAQPLDTSVPVRLDGSGNGRASIGPQSGVMWQVAYTTVSTVSQAAPIPQCAISTGNANGPVTLLDATFTGNGDSTDTPAVIYPGSYLWAVWAGGNPGDIATVRVQGQAVTRYRRGS